MDDRLVTRDRNTSHQTGVWPQWSNWLEYANKRLIYISNLQDSCSWSLLFSCYHLNLAAPKVPLERPFAPEIRQERSSRPEVSRREMAFGTREAERRGTKVGGVCRARRSILSRLAPLRPIRQTSVWAYNLQSNGSQRAIIRLARGSPERLATYDLLDDSSFGLCKGRAQCESHPQICERKSWGLST